MSNSLVLVHREAPIAVVQINRPEALNALHPELMGQLTGALQTLDGDEDIRAIVLTGSEKAFAAGADIKEMAAMTAAQMRQKDPLKTWDKIASVQKPLVAAVSGFCLGGGCEVAMMCDMIIASETARFGQPEINLGIIPGAGGTQRLTQVLGKFRAMEWILTGNIYSAKEAYEAGLVCKVTPAGEHLHEAKSLAKKIAEKSPLALRSAKKVILQSLNLPLAEGLQAERQAFYDLFDTQDQKEGMRAFLEKRPANFKGK